MRPPIPTYRGAVYPWHCDHMGHMNVMWYVGKFDQASWHLLSRIGLGPDYLLGERRGMVALEQRIAYRREVVAGDLLTVQSTLLDVRAKVLVLCHEMRNATSDEVVAVMTITTAHIDTALRRSCPLPEQIRRAALALVTDYEPGFAASGTW